MIFFQGMLFKEGKTKNSYWLFRTFQEGVLFLLKLL
jgi:hypothetical protein